MASDDDIAIGLRWKNVGCKPCGTTESALVRQTVALEVISAKGGKTKIDEVLPGESLKLELGGRSYVFNLDQADIPLVEGQGSLCGGAAWTLYRDGMQVELNDDGTPKES